MNTYQTITAPRRIFALLLALCLALALVPGMEMKVEAAEAPPTLNAMIYLKEGGEGWGLYYNDVEIPEGAGGAETLGGGSYSYVGDGDSGTLTLTNVNVTSSAANALQVSTSLTILTIELVGENSLESTESDDNNISAGLRSTNAIIITGSGLLAVTGGTTNNSSAGIGANSVTVENGATLTATGGQANMQSYGIVGSLTINGGTVTASGNTKAVSSSPTLPANYKWWKNDTPTDNSSTGGTLYPGGDAFNNGDSPKFIKISTQANNLYLDTGNKILRLGEAGGTEALSGVNYTGQYSYADGVLTLDNFSFTTSSPTALFLPNLETAVTIELVGENSLVSTYNSTSDSKAINANYALTITGDGRLAATGGTSSNVSYGIYIDGNDLTINGNATVTATGGIAPDSYGIYSGGGEITVDGNATVNATSSTATGGDSYGIWGNLAVNGGTVKLACGVGTNRAPWKGTTFTVPDSDYFYKIGSNEWVEITSDDFTDLVPIEVTTLEIAPVPTQTETLYYNLGDHKLHLGNRTGGPLAVENVHYTGKYEYKNGAPTFTNFSYTTSAATAFDLPSNVTIALEGDNSLVSTYAGDDYSRALFAFNNPTIGGNGTLTATGGTASNYSYGIFVSNGTLTINGNATVIATGGTSPESYGIQGNLTIVEGTVKLTSGTATSVSKPWYSGGAFTVPASGYRYKIDGGAWTEITDPDFKSVAQSATSTLEIAPLPLSTDASLSALTVTAGGETVTLDKTFAPGTLGYSATVAYDVDGVTISATANDENATVDGDTGIQDLEVGYNEFDITVTAEDDTTEETYTIGITRAAQGGDPGAPGDNPVTPTVTPAALSLTAGESGTLHLTLGTSYTGATISSSDLSVATVSPASVSAAGDVQVNAMAAGNVVITITFTGGTPAYSVVVPVIVAARSPYYPPIYRDPPEDGDGGSSDGGGGGGFAPDSATPPNAPTPVTLQQADDAAQDAIKDAMEKGSDTAYVKLINPGEIGLDVLEAIEKATRHLPGGAYILADSLTPDGKMVDVRIKLNVGEAIKSLKSGAITTLNLAASTRNAAAKQVKGIFETWYVNDLQTVHFEMQGIWGQPVEVAVKLDPGMDSGTLHFYAYNKTTNAYTRLKNPNYWVDKNGYVHFTTELAGDIIISEGELVRK